LKKFIFWRSAGIYWVKLIFARGGGESFKDAFTIRLFSTVVEDEEKMKIFMESFLV